MFYANPPTKENELYDEILPKTVDALNIKINQRDDDALLIFAGRTGGGKSNLMLHAEELYLKEKADIKYVALKQEDFADIQYEIQNEPKPRSVAYDEANVNKRNSMKTWNKDLIDLYLSNRGKNILHLWCNPTVEYLDKFFINERVSGVIYVLKKSFKRNGKEFRPYFYFTRDNILKLLEDKGDLKQKTIEKNAYRYAFYCGWFSEYKGKLLKDYLNKKNSRMEDKSLDFKNKHGTKEELYKPIEIARELDISDDTLNKLTKKYINNGELILNKHYIINALTGHKKFKKDALDVFKSDKSGEISY